MNSATENSVVEKGHKIDFSRTTFGIIGLIALVVGILILVFPGQSGLAVMQATAIIIAAWMLISGVVYLGTGIFESNRPTKSRTLSVILGIIFLVGGFIVALNVTATAAVLALSLSITVGVVWIIEGIYTFVGLKTSAHKTMTIVYGVISLLAGIVLVTSPLLSFIALWWLLGISLGALGFVQLVRAFSMKAK